MCSSEAVWDSESPAMWIITVTAASCGGSDCIAPRMVVILFCSSSGNNSRMFAGSISIWMVFLFTDFFLIS